MGHVTGVEEVRNQSESLIKELHTINLFGDFRNMSNQSVCAFVSYAVQSEELGTRFG
jgi:hypothetical protein